MPYVERPKKGLQPTIIVDSNEASSAPKIVFGLMDRGAEIKKQKLSDGDYIVSDRCAIERKTVQDFAYTLTRRYLFDQLSGLKDLYATPIILLEGYLPIIYKYSRINPSAIWGAMFTLARQGIPLVHTTNYKETVDFLYTASRQEQLVERRAPVVHAAKKTETLSDAQMYFIASLPNIGREKARVILKSYQTPMRALGNVDNWTTEVHGLGPVISRRVKKLLYTSYEA